MLISFKNLRIISFIIILIIIFICKIYTIKLEPYYMEKHKQQNIESFYTSNKENLIVDIPLKFNRNYNINTFIHDEAYELYNESNYLETMNQINIEARGYNNKSMIKNQYMNSLLLVTNEDILSVNELCNKMIEKIITKSKPVNVFLTKWIIKYVETSRIGKGNKWLENGMPHTHNNIIIFPQTWYDEVNNASKTNFKGIGISTENNALFYNAGTFVHELTHIHQRINYNIYLELYKLWGFIYASYIDGMDNILARNRHNPDGMDSNWIWYDSKDNQYYWIGAIFKSNSPYNLNDITSLAYPLEKINNSSYKLQEFKLPKILNEFHNFKTYYAINNNHYHPNEIVAEYMENYYQASIGLKGHLNCQGYKLFLNNINNILII